MESIEIESIGKLLPPPDNPDDWLVSKPIPIAFFGGQPLEITFDLDLENDKDALHEANDAISNFLRKDASDRLDNSDLVYKNYREIQDYYDSEPFDLPPLKLKDKSDIWKYVYPHELYICRGFDDDKIIYVLISCDCEWEEEHGLQLVFKNGLELTRVSGIDYNPV